MFAVYQAPKRRPNFNVSNIAPSLWLSSEASARIRHDFRQLYSDSIYYCMLIILLYYIASNMPEPPTFQSDWLNESYLQLKPLLLLYRWHFGMSMIEHHPPLHLLHVPTTSNRTDNASSMDAGLLELVASCSAAPPYRRKEPAKLYYRPDRPCASFFHYKEYNEQIWYPHSIGYRIEDIPTWTAAPSRVIQSSGIHPTFETQNSTEWVLVEFEFRLGPCPFTHNCTNM